jgi:hypothetical protein
MILGLATIFAVGAIGEIIFKVAGKAINGGRELAIEREKTEQAKLNLERDKLKADILLTRICSSAGHTCGAPYHPGEYKIKSRYNPGDPVPLIDDGTRS